MSVDDRAPRHTAAGDEIPGACHIIAIRVDELWQLFNEIDPSPFRERDLDPRAEEFIVDWSRDVPADAPLALVVHLERAPGPAGEAVMLRDALHEFFGQQNAGQDRVPGYGIDGDVAFGLARDRVATTRGPLTEETSSEAD